MTELEFVGKTYPGGAVAMKSLTHTVPKYQTVVLIGSSGSGRTTLLRIVNRMADPTSGRALIDGVSVREVGPIKLRQSVGYVLRDDGLFPHCIVADNIATVLIFNGMPRCEVRSVALELLEWVGLGSELSVRYLARFSGGRCQCVGVTRALAAEPEILLMDELFGAIDPIVRRKPQNELIRLQGEIGKMVVFVMHDVREVFCLYDGVIVLSEGGKIAQSGTPEGILIALANDFMRTFASGTKSNQTLRARQVAGHSVAVGEDGCRMRAIEGFDGFVGGKDTRNDDARE